MLQQAASLIPDQPERPLRRSLPPGWRVLASARHLPCHVLAHPDEGVILLDLTEHGTPGAEHRLGACMTAAGLRRDGMKPPPVWYARIEPARMARLEALLTDALAAQRIGAPSPTHGWVEPLEAALKADAVWGRQRMPLSGSMMTCPNRVAAAAIVLLLAGLAAWLSLASTSSATAAHAPAFAAGQIAATGINATTR